MLMLLKSVKMKPNNRFTSMLLTLALYMGMDDLVLGCFVLVQGCDASDHQSQHWQL